jgi:hypothetical protein
MMNNGRKNDVLMVIMVMVMMLMLLLNDDIEKNLIC